MASAIYHAGGGNYLCCAVTTQATLGEGLPSVSIRIGWKFRIRSTSFTDWISVKLGIMYVRVRYTPLLLPGLDVWIQLELWVGRALINANWEINCRGLTIIIRVTLIDAFLMISLIEVFPGLTKWVCVTLARAIHLFTGGWTFPTSPTFGPKNSIVLPPDGQNIEQSAHRKFWLTFLWHTPSPLL